MSQYTITETKQLVLYMPIIHAWYMSCLISRSFYIADLEPLVSRYTGSTVYIFPISFVVLLVATSLESHFLQGTLHRNSKFASFWHGLMQKSCHKYLCIKSFIQVISFNKIEYFHFP